MNIEEIVHLSDLLSELDGLKRATRLPSGENESDSHHSFSLALIAYDIRNKYCPELNAEKLFWADRQRQKFTARLKVQPPKPVLRIYESSFEELRKLWED